MSRSSRARLLALLVAAIAVAVGIIVHAISGPGAPSTRRDAVRATIDAATAGDFDRLLALSRSDDLSRELDCDDAEYHDFVVRDLQHALHDRLREGAASWQGASVELVDVSPGERPEAHEAGERYDAHCTYHRRWVFEAVRARVRIGGAEQDLTFRMIQEGQTWTLRGLPTLDRDHWK
jgi:hypothetical protein